ncbi:hypothetical protein LTR84_005245 [Exophiala bonariae]|uniref:Uncharacterized protein n=1 Tax=Exophiala bonariae TaxID=1690606 RepID=A0AAV9NSR0_9EURO|nr:hypothetical protein LTR84_005245 [Exophiala bonariae]
MAEDRNATTAVWDFAYSTGSYGMATGKATLWNTFTTQEPELNSRTATHRKQQPSESKKSISSIIVNSLHPASATTSATVQVCPDAGKSSSLRSRFKTKAHSNSKSKHHSRDSQDASASQRTYLLSIPRADRVYCTQMREIVSTLLLTPQTQLVLLVPQSHIVCERMCDLGRLSKAPGSGLRILPVPCEIPMEYGGMSGMDDDDEGSQGGSTYFENPLEMLAVQEIAAKVLKCTKFRRFDGYLAFEDERASWVFLERVGKAVAGLSPAGGGGRKA